VIIGSSRSKGENTVKAAPDELDSDTAPDRAVSPARGLTGGAADGRLGTAEPRALLSSHTRRTDYASAPLNLQLSAPSRPAAVVAELLLHGG
jgi:hypothetical protein